MGACCEEPCSGGTLDKLLQPAILTALAGTDGAHGYELDNQIEGMSLMRGQKPDLGGVYRLLKRMEQRGLVASDWDLSEPGPAKRVYHVTDAGMDCLARWVQTLSEYRSAIDELVHDASEILRRAKGDSRA
jgi:DNA-binding PadR family transcriptional regulator